MSSLLPMPDVRRQNIFVGYISAGDVILRLYLTFESFKYKSMLILLIFNSYYPFSINSVISSIDLHF